MSASPTWVIKIGTSSLTHSTGKINIRVIEKLATVLSDLMNAGYRIALVTSGAIGVGVSKLGLRERPTDTAGKQAAAMVGQCELMYYYDKMFSEYGYRVGQLLITKEDVDDELRRKNLINTFEKLFDFGAIPIINENDAVAVEEIVYGDNDNLSAVVAKLINADRLIILTETNGIFDCDPTVYPNAKRISEISDITDNMLRIDSDTKTALGTGGVATKIHAAQIASNAGIQTHIIKGDDPDNIYKVLNNEDIGTTFKAKIVREKQDD